MKTITTQILFTGQGVFKITFDHSRFSNPEYPMVYKGNKIIVFDQGILIHYEDGTKRFTRFENRLTTSELLLAIKSNPLWFSVLK